MLNIGCHLSTTKGFENMGKEILEAGGNTFQFFTRNPRGGKAKDIDEKDIERLLEIAKKNNFAKLLAHAPYTLNPVSYTHLLINKKLSLAKKLTIFFCNKSKKEKCKVYTVN